MGLIANHLNMVQSHSFCKLCKASKASNSCSYCSSSVSSVSCTIIFSINSRGFFSLLVLKTALSAFLNFNFSSYSSRCFVLSWTFASSSMVDVESPSVVVEAWPLPYLSSFDSSEAAPFVLASDISSVAVSAFLASCFSARILLASVMAFASSSAAYFKSSLKSQVSRSSF